MRRLSSRLPAKTEMPTSVTWETHVEGGMLARITTTIPPDVHLGPGDVLTFDCMLRLEPNGKVTR